MSTIKNIFISRKVSNAAFKQQLINRSIDLHDMSLVDISPLPFAAIPESEWIFFYSKNGVRHFFSQLPEDLLASLGQKKFGVMGNGSNTLLKQHLNRDANFIGGANVSDSTTEFWNQVKKDNVLFIKASNSLGSFELADKENQTKKLEVYSNVISTISSIPQCDIVALTSPMNAQAFCQAHDLTKVKSVIAIGQTTKSTLNELSPDKDILLVDEPSEKAILNYIFKML